MTAPQQPEFPQDPATVPAPAADVFAPAAPTAPTARKLTRSRTDKMLGGVCGGIAEYFGIDATWVRIAFVVSVVLPGPQLILYLLLWLIIPQAD